MPKFGKKSKAELETCAESLQKIAHVAVQLTDFSVLEGHRGELRQNRLFMDHKSKVQWPDSKHNKKPSQAFDLAPYPIDWSNKLKAKARFYYLAGVILTLAWLMNTPLRYGGDWDGDGDFFDQSFDDLGHFELREDT